MLLVLCVHWYRVTTPGRSCTVVLFSMPSCACVHLHFWTQVHERWGRSLNKKQVCRRAIAAMAAAVHALRPHTRHKVTIHRSYRTPEVLSDVLVIAVHTVCALTHLTAFCPDPAPSFASTTMTATGVRSLIPYVFSTNLLLPSLVPISLCRTTAGRRPRPASGGAQGQRLRGVPGAAAAAGGWRGAVRALHAPARITPAFRASLRNLRGRASWYWKCMSS